MVFIIGAAGKSPSSIHPLEFSRRKSPSSLRTPFPSYFVAPLVDHCHLCLTPWKGSVSPTYRMMGWCWRLSLHSQGNHTFFFSTDLLYTTGLILWSFPYLLLDEKKTTHTVFYRTLLKVSKCEMSISLDAC